MTDAEALLLRCDDRVIGDVGGECVLLIVVGVEYWGREDKPWVRARRPGVRANGLRWPAVRRFAADLTLAGKCDPLTANIYADWLDEHGEARAAALLRRAFPIDAGVTK